MKFSGFQPPKVITQPGAEFAPSTRIWQGISTIEISDNGRLWAAWYTGQRFEMPGNYIVLTKSDDDGQNWEDPTLIIYPNEGCRHSDPCLWIDPKGKLWLFWTQSGGFKYLDGYGGVWAITSENHTENEVRWSEPFRIFHGVMLQKPLATSNGDWLLPISNWTIPTMQGKKFELPTEVQPYAGAGVVASQDEGLTWNFRGAARINCASYDEHSLIERKDKSLWMLLRTLYGIGQSESRDGGMTWSRGHATDLDGPDSKFFIRRLLSGNLLLINHVNFTNRSHLTATLSRDDGRTWEGGLLLDERQGVSYPDGCQANDGLIHICYDRERGGMRLSLSSEEFENRKFHQREILRAQFTERDVLAGRCVTPKARLKNIISRLGPRPDFNLEKFIAEGGIDWQDDTRLQIIG